MEHLLERQYNRIDLELVNGVKITCTCTVVDTYQKMSRRSV